RFAGATPQRTQNLILQGLATIEGTTLTSQQIIDTGTTVNVSSILTNNPYEGYVLPDSSTYTPLKNLGWIGVYDKVSPADEVFGSDTFSKELLELLDLGVDNTTVITRRESYEYPIIDITDDNFFEDCSWTIAYSPKTQSWVSYYSFIPDYYN